MKDLTASYTEFHARKNPTNVYPPEWLIRTLLGTYPRLSIDHRRYPNSRILDVGFGDGRNWPLLDNIGFHIHGVEITDRIVALGYERARHLGIEVDLKTGSNAAIPFEDEYFDFIVASSSCYYLDDGTVFADNLREYSRVLKPGGILLASLPESTNAIFEGAVNLGDGVVEIRNDPWNLRNGYRFRWFVDEDDVREAFSPWFESFSIGLCRDNYYGIQINAFLLVCERKSR